MSQEAPSTSPTAGRHGHARSGGLRFHYVEAGTGPLVVLLHGFPEFWYSWRHQISALAGAGFHVIAPDLRGYNESDKPAGVRHYQISLLVGDVLGLIQQAGATRAVVVGHDWGGIIAWRLALDHPEAVERLVILNAPHPAAFFRALRYPRQWLRSWYILFFQLPWLPECLLQGADFWLLERMFRHQPTRSAAFSPQDIRRYKRAWSAPRALTSALHYYRAALRYPARQTQDNFGLIGMPTLLIWGERDLYLGIQLIEDCSRWVPNLQVERIAAASHWVQNDAPERVNHLLLEFLAPLLR